MYLFRLIKIVYVLIWHRLDTFFTRKGKPHWVQKVFNVLLFWRSAPQQRAERLRLALEALGPIFVKFGQMLSTRRDLLPPDVADELTKLQDRVPPFPFAQVQASIEQAFGQPLNTIYSHFEAEPVASASVAQVHFATLLDGQEVAVKVLRPNIADTIRQDIAILRTLAWWLQNLIQ